MTCTPAALTHPDSNRFSVCAAEKQILGQSHGQEGMPRENDDDEVRSLVVTEPNRVFIPPPPPDTFSSSPPPMVGSVRSILVLRSRYLSPEQEIKHTKVRQCLLSVLLKTKSAEDCGVKDVKFASGATVISNLIC